MKRLHIHLTVSNLDRSVAFYSALFGSAPTVIKPDYARWMVDDPAVNFVISDRMEGAPGVSHLGLQAGDDTDLAQIEERFAAASGPVEAEGETTCCYARSRKSWTADPDGIAWEAFKTHGESDEFGHDPGLDKITVAAPSAPADARDAGCCG